MKAPLVIQKTLLPHLFLDAKLGQEARPRGTLCAEDLSAGPAVVLPCHESEWRPAPVAHLALLPLGRHVRLEHGLGLAHGRKLPALGLHQIQGVL